MNGWRTSVALAALSTACASAAPVSNAPSAEPVAAAQASSAPPWTNPRCGGSLDHEAAMIAMRRAQPIIRHCYERGLLRNPSLHGHVDLDVHVGPDGSVAGVRVRTRMRDPDIVACIGRTAAHLRLGAPSPPGDCAVLSAPFNFAPE